MKIFITDKTLDKLKEMVNTMKPDFISVRKYKKDADNESNVIKGVKLSDKQRQLHKAGKSYRLYVNKKKLLEVTKLINDKPETYKEGGILPFLVPLFAGISALGTIAGGSAAVAKTIIDKKANDARLQEEQRHNEALESAARGEGLYLNPYKEGEGICVKQVIKDFSDKLNIDDIGKKAVRNILKNMKDYVQIRQEKNGNGLYLQPLN